MASSLLLTHAQLQQASVYDEETEAFLPYPSRTLNDIEGYTTKPQNLEFSTYGGWKSHQVEATGFFRVEEIDGRWWVIDPEGYQYIHKAVNSVQIFGDFSTDQFADHVYELLPEFGMNGTGNWSDPDIQNSSLKEVTPLAYCPKFSFVSSYKNSRDDELLIAVFDEEFVDFCERKAEEKFSIYVDDPHVFGYFIDNELSWTFRGGLESHIDVNDPQDLNYQKAVEFMTSRGKTVNSNVTDEDADDYSAIMAERYFSVVCGAVRAVDPNHMILGPRLNKSWNRSKEFMEVAGRYLDIVALNHYHRWGSRSNELENIHKWTGRPVLMSEFYAMKKIEGFEEKGAGWRVEDEASRVLFYENFLTTQLEKKFVVGFHWFNFQDDAQDDNANIPKARKGIIDLEGNSYTELRDSMKYMNDRIYDYIEHIDAVPEPDVTIIAEADAYYQGSSNFGSGSELWAETGSASLDRRFYIRFDTSSLTEEVTSAKIQLFSTSPDEKLTGRYIAELVTDNTWSETGINTSNNPAGSTQLATWGHGDDIEIDVTDALLAALDDDNKLSIRVYGTLNNGAELLFGSREYPDVYARPKLAVYYNGTTTPPVDPSTHVISSENFEEGLGLWNSAGSDSRIHNNISGPYAHQGNGAALLRDDSDTSYLTSNVLDLASYSSVTVDFWYYTVDFNDDHEFWLEISTNGGSSYEIVKVWTAGSDFENENFQQGSYTISDVTFSANTLLRFKSEAQFNSDKLYLDEIKVSAEGEIETVNYSEWIASRPGLGNTNAFDDPDEDGIDTIIEYVLNTDPTESDRHTIPELESSEDNYIFVFNRLTDSAQHTEQIFQYTVDNENWTDVKITEPTNAMVTISTRAGGMQTVKVILDKGAESEGKLFGRLKVSETP